jgi:hypothetical protein
VTTDRPAKITIEPRPQPRQIGTLRYAHHYQQDTPTRGQGNWFASLVHGIRITSSLSTKRALACFHGQPSSTRAQLKSDTASRQSIPATPSANAHPTTQASRVNEAIREPASRDIQAPSEAERSSR